MLYLNSLTKAPQAIRDFVRATLGDVANTPPPTNRWGTKLAALIYLSRYVDMTDARQGGLEYQLRSSPLKR